MDDLDEFFHHVSELPDIDCVTVPHGMITKAQPTGENLEYLLLWLNELAEEVIKLKRELEQVRNEDI